MMKRIMALALASIMSTQVVFAAWPAAVDAEANQSAKRGLKRQYLIATYPVTHGVMGGAQTNAWLDNRLAELEANNGQQGPNVQANVQQPQAPQAQIMDRVLNAAKENPQITSGCLACFCFALTKCALVDCASQIPEQANLCNCLGTVCATAGTTACCTAWNYRRIKNTAKWIGSFFAEEDENKKK